MIILFLLASISSWAAQPNYWSHILEVTDRHEFYRNHEVISKPVDSWQHLFSLSYINSDLGNFKDCVFYKVPGQEAGVLKLKTIPSASNCDDQMLSAGDLEYKDIKSLHFAVLDTNVSMDIAFGDYRIESWTAQIQSRFAKPEAKMSLSSAEFKAPKMIFLAPKTISKSIQKKPFLKNGSLCYDVNEDCQAVSVSNCGQCNEGWYEVPNGCIEAPRYCGRLKCGGKDQPACQRGTKWQRKEKTYECRMDSSFAYCSKGLVVQCEGKKAYCR
jgi:hypothetical protein